VKVQDFLILSVGSVLVIFMLLSFFYHGGEEYGIEESDNYGNISLSDYKKSLESAEDTAETLQEVFEKDSAVEGGLSLIFKGLPSAGKTIFRWTIDSVKLVLVGAKKVFATPAFTIALGVLMAILILIFIITNWDWIRGIVPGS
jgi:hypothetical protein